MAQLSELLVAFATSALLTLFDLDRTVYIPSNIKKNLYLYSSWWGFVAVNGLLAAALYPLLKDIGCGYFRTTVCWSQFDPYVISLTSVGGFGHAAHPLGERLRPTNAFIAAFLPPKRARPSQRITSSAPEIVVSD
jgi:hypothetical protein